MASGMDKKLAKHLQYAICLERFKDPKGYSVGHSHIFQACCRGHRQFLLLTLHHLELLAPFPQETVRA